MFCPPSPQLLTPNLFSSHIRDRGNTLGSGYIPGSDPSPSIEPQNMLTIDYLISCKGELVKCIYIYIYMKFEVNLYVWDTFLPSFDLKNNKIVKS